MERLNNSTLIKQRVSLRDKKADLNGSKLPASVLMLIQLLESSADKDVRYDVYQHLLSECRITQSSELECQFGKMHYEEFRDSLSAMKYASALIECKKFEMGIAVSKSALKAAISDQAFINDTATSYIREAVKTNLVEYVNEAIYLMLESVDLPRLEDCKLETDWLEAAVQIGANQSMLDKVRAL